MNAMTPVSEPAALAGYYSLRRRPGTDGFYLLLDGRRIGNVFAPVNDTDIDTWGVSIACDAFPERHPLPAPFSRHYYQFARLDDVFAFIDAIEPPQNTYSAWSYEAGFHSAAAL